MTKPLSDASNTRDALVVLFAFSIGQAIHINNGVIHPAAIGWLFLGIIFIATAMMPATLKRFKMLPRIPINALLGACLGIQWLQLGYDACYIINASWMIFSLLVSAAGMIVVVVLPHRLWQGFAMILAGHLLCATISIHERPKPGIDVWMFQQDSAEALLHGQDPYAAKFKDIYGPELGYYSPGMAVDGWLTYSYPYPPLMLLMTAPGRIFGDVRWAHLVAVELAAILLVLASRNTRAILAAAMFLFTPRCLFVVQVGWTEPMVVLLVSACIYCAAKQRGLLWIAFGLLLAIKQYIFITAPLLFLLLPAHEARRTLIRSFMLAIGITLPFLAWNPTSFVRSTILWQLRQPFRGDALSITALLQHVLGFTAGAWLWVGAVVGAILLSFKRAPRSLYGFALSMCLVLLSFFATNKQAFCNYYFLVVGVACGAIAILDVPLLQATAEWETQEDQPAVRLAT